LTSPNFSQAPTEPPIVKERLPEAPGPVWFPLRLAGSTPAVLGAGKGVCVFRCARVEARPVFFNQDRQALELGVYSYLLRAGPGSTLFPRNGDRETALDEGSRNSLGIARCFKRKDEGRLREFHRLLHVPGMLKPVDLTPGETKPNRVVPQSKFHTGSANFQHIH
jgi:hypothetical protein